MNYKPEDFARCVSNPLLALVFIWWIKAGRVSCLKKCFLFGMATVGIHKTQHQKKRCVGCATAPRNGHSGAGVG